MERLPSMPKAPSADRPKAAVSLFRICITPPIVLPDDGCYFGHQRQCRQQPLKQSMKSTGTLPAVFANGGICRLSASHHHACLLRAIVRASGFSGYAADDGHHVAWVGDYVAVGAPVPDFGEAGLD